MGGRGRLPRYLPVLIEGQIGTYFSSFFGAAFIDLGDKDEWRIAGDVIHELTHAYLLARWKVPYRGQLRFDHERLCCAEEVRLVRRMIRVLDRDPEEGARYLARLAARHRKPSSNAAGSAPDWNDWWGIGGTSGRIRRVLAANDWFHGPVMNRPGS